MTTGGGDVSVQSSGLSINLVTKSGSNVFKGSAVGTFENDAMQGQNVTKELFDAGANGFLSGNPLKKITNYSVEYGGPIMKNKLWFWGAADKQDINVGILNFFDAEQGRRSATTWSRRRRPARLRCERWSPTTSSTTCRSACGNDKTVIKDLQWKFNYQLNARQQVPVPVPERQQVPQRAAAPARRRRRKRRRSRPATRRGGCRCRRTRSLHTWIASDKLVFNNQFTYVHGGFFLDYQDVPPQGNCAQSRYTGSRHDLHAQDAGCLWNTQSLLNRTTGVSEPLADRDLPDDAATRGKLKTDGTYFLTHMLGGDHSLKFGLGWRTQPDPDLLALQRRRARAACSASATPLAGLRRRRLRAGGLGGRHRAVPGGALSRRAR